MKVAIPVEFEPFVQSIIGSGTYKTEAEVVGEALRILKKREQLRRDVNDGIKQLEEGEGVDGEEVFERLEKKAEAIAHQPTAQDE